MSGLRSWRTTWAGALAGLGLVLYGASRMLRGEEVSAESILLILSGVGVAGLGRAGRDDAVTSEGTKAELRRRG